MATSLSKKVLPLRVQDAITRTITPFLHTRANCKGVCSDKTAADRKQTIFLLVAELWILGFHIEKPSTLTDSDPLLLIGTNPASARSYAVKAPLQVSV